MLRIGEDSNFRGVADAVISAERPSWAAVKSLKSAMSVAIVLEDTAVFVGGLDETNEIRTKFSPKIRLQ